VNSLRADADDALVTVNAIISDVDVVVAGGEVVASRVSQRNVVEAALEEIKRKIPIGGIEGARLV
jgi:hypothetical protein